MTKRSDSIVRRIAPFSASIWWILRARYSPTQSVPRRSQARIATLRGRRDGGNDLARAWVDLLDPVVDGRSQHDDGGASIGASAMPRGVASMRASGRDRCLQPATHRSPIGQVVRREAGRQVLLFSRDDHERHQRHRWHEGDE